MAVQCSAGGTYLSSYPASNMPSTASALTLMGWVNFNGWGSTTTSSMIGIYDGSATASTSPTSGVQLGARNVAGQFYAWTWGGITLVNTTAGSPTLSNGSWIHVAYTCTAISGGSQTHSLYINGSLAGTSTNSNQTAANTTQIYLNGYPQTSGGTNESSTCMIDGVALYNRILSADEILTIYNLKGLRDGIVAGLVSRYAFLEAGSGSISNCIDYTRNANMISGSGTALTYTTGICYNNSRPRITS
ncbi:MAG: LamG domain-containing protein [Gammaproteobacteria bacterium]|nr:LamG domain-containing protein [Gammaproteobacteria bacterium]